MSNNIIKPPKWPLVILRFFIKGDYLEEIEGDLNELYAENRIQYSEKKSNRLFWFDVIKLLRPSLLRKLEGTYRLNSYGLMKNNFKIAIRSLRRNSLFTTINVSGLAVGLASSFLLLLFVMDEFSYDKFFTDSDKIYKVALDRTYTDHQSTGRNIPHSFANVAVEDYAEIERSTVLTESFRDMLLAFNNQSGDKQKSYENVVAADSNFFAFFDFKLIKGNPETALKEPRSMVLTESAAIKFFGDSDPIGKTIKMAGDEFNVTGICEDIPANTHLQFSFLMSINTIGRFNQQNYSRPDVGCYFKVRTGTDIGALELKFTEMVDNYAAAEVEQLNSVSWSDYKNSGNGFRYFLVPLSAVYLHPDDLGGFKPGGNDVTTWIAFGVAIMILLLACINFINLSTAKSMDRAHEVGVRKVLGSRKRQLVFQFLTESVIISLAGTILALILLFVFNDYIDSLNGKSLSIKLTADYLGYFIITGLSLGLLAGIYPAFIISSFKPVLILKGKYIKRDSSNWLRNGLVVFQFIISIGFLIGLFVINSQIKFLLNKDLGFDKEHLLVVTGDFHMEPQFANSFVDKLRLNPEVKSAAGSLSVPGMGIFWENNIHIPESTEIITARSMVVGDGFLEVFGIKLKSGRIFQPETQDASSIIINESTAKILNLVNPLGKKIMLNDRGEESQFEIIGVIEDFNFDYLYNAISPLVIKSNELMKRKAGKLVARLHPNTNVFDAVTKIEAQWKEARPEEPFTFQFVDQVVDGYYNKEIELLAIFKVFSFLSIFIAGMGLFALSAHVASIRTKEIGIRKILGASMGNLILLLIKPFTILIFIAFAIAIPITWYGLENFWLNNFAYHIILNVSIIAKVMIMILMISWAVTGYYTIKTARLNPVDSLNEE